MQTKTQKKHSNNTINTKYQIITLLKLQITTLQTTTMIERNISLLTVSTTTDSSLHDTESSAYSHTKIGTITLLSEEIKSLKLNNHQIEKN